MHSFAPPASEPQDRPDVTIVMPVFNKLELTEACLASLHREAGTTRFEVLVIDNGSTDGTGPWLARQEEAGRLRRVTNSENLGFARGCNLGAAQARGRHLLFLNNDMEVTAGWLEPLVWTLDGDPGVGIVGARLLFADGTIQHGGVALVQQSKNGRPHLTGIHLSYRKPADHPGAAHALVMQVVTGACLAIRREVFTAAGGFDEGYWNGNEDVDLCLRVRELGWSVVYRPESVVYHYESQSGPERYSQVAHNVKRLNERWFGRAKPDFVQEPDGCMTPTPDNQIRNYAAPRLSVDSRAVAMVEPRASVVVLTWNALEHTKRCFESLLAHTDARHELVFVDNGSTDGTVAWLAGLSARRPGTRVVLNAANLGFAAGNNVGIAAAAGDFVVLLNSDTVVTPGWLERLLQPALADPRVGLVGPLTNNVTGGQKVAKVDYDQATLAGLEEYAERLAEANRGKVAPALWIVGFCLLVRREVVARLGGLDEVFGKGNYEDTDYCLRAFLAGYRAVVARDCFIHHVGSASFDAAGVDYSRQMDENFEIFRRKWRLDRTARATGQFDLPAIFAGGLAGPLRFRPLPASPHFRPLSLPAWESTAWLERGEAAYSRGDLDEAELWFRAVHDLQPDLPRAVNNLAVVLWRQDPDGEGRQQASHLLEAVLARDPGDEDARWNLAEITGAETPAALAARP